MPAKWKIKEVEQLSKKLSESPVVAVAGVKGLPSKQFQEIRAKLHGRVDIKVVKNRLARLAIEKSSRKGLKDLEKHIEGPTALVFSQENPFKLYQMFAESRVKAPAKAGQEAPEDIVVPAGDTPFKPGPIIGDLQEAGIKAKIQGPIIVVAQDSPVIKQGEEFSAKLATVLAQMDILPMEIGIDIRAALEDGMLYEADVLRIDKEKTLSDFAAAHQNAISLAVEAGIYNAETTGIMIAKAAREARNLALEAEIYNAETMDYFLSKAGSEAKGLAAAAKYEPGAAAEEKKEEPKEEKAKEAPEVEAEEEKAEEAKEEKPVEGAPREEAKPEEVKEEPKEEKKEEAPTGEKEEVKEEAPAEEKKEAETESGSQTKSE